MEQISLYQKRRNALGAAFSRTLFIIPSGGEAKRSHSVNYRFKPASDFAYLCGLHLADATLIILGAKTLLLWDSPQDQVWGEHTDLGETDREKLAGITLLATQDLEEIVRAEAGNYDRIAVSLHRNSSVEQKVISAISYDRKMRGKLTSPLNLCDSRLLVGTIRLQKDQTELKALREAGARSSRVHTRLMAAELRGKTEREISNWIEAQFLLENMQWTAYETIVGSGERSTVLHARATERVIQEGELLLIDAGGEWQGYCADITRTLPAGFAFTKAQAEIYDVVLAAQKLALQQVRPGSSLQEIHEAAVHALTEGLIRLGDEEGSVRKRISSLMPHPTSHWIGMDVHDPCPHLDDRGDPIRLQKGMCFTVEPGLYFREKTDRFYGIGVRIEDDAVVTDSGYELLNDVPKERAEIEEIRSR